MNFDINNSVTCLILADIRLTNSHRIKTVVSRRDLFIPKSSQMNVCYNFYLRYNAYVMHLHRRRCKSNEGSIFLPATGFFVKSELPI